MNKSEKNTDIILDAENRVFGRLASLAAQHAIRGKNVVVVNAEKAILTGKKDFVLKKFRTRINLTVKGNPHKAPKYSRMPDRMLRRAIRGMLPFKQAKGRDALKRVRVLIGMPKELEGKKFFEQQETKAKKRRNFVVLGEICRLLGASW